MPTIDLETAVTDFLALGRRLQSIQPLTGERVFSELVSWYQNTRLEGASLADGVDMLLLQWGGSREIVLSEPTDLRQGWDEPKFTDAEISYLNFTRQVFAQGEDEDEEFDDSAVHMSITLGFEPADGSEENSNEWIHNPGDLDRGKQKFIASPFVQSRLNTPTKSIAISIDYCG